MSKLAKNITIRFIAVLLLFSSLLALVFYKSYEKTTFRNYQVNLEQQVSAIAKTIEESEIYQNQDQEIQNTIEQDNSNNFGGHHRNQRSNNNHMGRGRNRRANPYQNVLKIINDSVAGEVLIVDQNLMCSHSNTEMMAPLELTDDSIIQQVLEGEITSQIKYDADNDLNIITAGAPIIDENGTVKNAVLLNMDVSALEVLTSATLKDLFLAFAVSLIVGFILIALFTRNFTQPLLRMAHVTQDIANSNFNQKTNIDRDDELGELARNIDIMSDKLKASEQERLDSENRKRDFLANISHELRTPVTVMRSYLESLKTGIVKDDEKEDYYQQMLEESIVLENLINDLLQLTKLQNVDYEIEKEDVQLNLILEDAIRSQRLIAKEKEVTLNVDITESDYRYFGDYQLLRQLFIILINNAIKFSDPQSTVSINLNSDEIRIQNFGDIIEPEDLDHVFDRFHHAGLGNGIGLTIAKEIAERHNAHISVESSIQNGTIFTIHY